MIPADFVDDLLTKVDIVDVIAERVSLKKGGQNYMACCPFHKEKTPSFTVAPNKQFYHCFGCGSHGSAIGFLMEYEQLSFVEAVQKLADRVGLIVPHEGRQESPQVREEKKKQRQSLEGVLTESSQFYRQGLQQSKRAEKYLQSRGLNSEIIEHFLLGYVSESWHGLLTALNHYPKPLLLESGMIAEKDGRYYDRFRDRIMFPIRNAQGQVIAFGGRILDKGEPKYLNSPQTPLFDKGRQLYGLFEARAGINQAKKVLVVEGYMDVVSLAQSGIDYAVASLGTAITPDQIKLLLRQSDAIYFCFDGDAAGRKAAWRALENALPLLKDDKALYFLFLPAEHDPDSYINAYGKAQFESTLSQDSLPLSQYWLKHLSSFSDLKANEDNARLMQMAGSMLNQIEAAPNLRFLMTQDLANLVKQDMADVYHLLGQSTPVKAKSYRQISLPTHSFRQPKLVTLVEKQIRWLVLNPEWAHYVVFPDYLLLSEDCACLQELSEVIGELSQPSASHILEHLRGNRYAQRIGQIISAMPKENKEFNMPTEEDENTFRDGITRLIEEIYRQQTAELIKKSEHQKLSADEEHLLLTLLKK